LVSPEHSVKTLLFFTMLAHRVRAPAPAIALSDTTYPDGVITMFQRQGGTPGGADSERQWSH
jgi:hypothetical protein